MFNDIIHQLDPIDLEEEIQIIYCNYVDAIWFKWIERNEVGMLTVKEKFISFPRQTKETFTIRKLAIVKALSTSINKKNQIKTFNVSINKSLIFLLIGNTLSLLTPNPHSISGRHKQITKYCKKYLLNEISYEELKQKVYDYVKKLVLKYKLTGEIT